VVKIESDIGNCQFKGVHHALLIAQFLDPRFKSLPFVPDVLDAESKVAIKERFGHCDSV